MNELCASGARGESGAQRFAAALLAVISWS